MSGSRLNGILGFCCALVLGAFGYIVNRAVIGPIIQPDEGSYLANAAAIAGYYNDLASSFSSGYSLLLVPAFHLFSDPAEIWSGVIKINALVYFFFVLGAWCLSNRLAGGNRSVSDRLLAVLLVGCYPFWITMVGYGFPQLALGLLFVWAMYFLCRALDGGHSWWLGFSILIGFAYWIHPTGVVIGLAGLSVGLLVSYSRKSPFYATSSVGFVLMGVVGYRYGMTPWLHSYMTLGGVPQLHYPSMHQLISVFLSVDGIFQFVVRLSGHAFYLLAGSVGLIGVCLIEVMVRLKAIVLRECTACNLEKEVAVLSFMCLSIAGITTVSALLIVSTPEAVRLDHWLYGRYVEAVIAPALLLGALTMNRTRLFWAGVMIMVAALGLGAGIGGYSHTARFNVAAFWQDFLIRDAGLWWWAVSACLAVFISFLLPRMGASAFILSVFVSCIFLQTTWHKAAAKNVSGRWEIAHFIRDSYETGACVAFDHSGINSYSRRVFWNDLGFQLFDYRMQRLSVSEWLVKCNGPLITYDEELDRKGFDVHLLATSPLGGPSVWERGAPSIERAFYPINALDRGSKLSSLLRSGWHDLEREHVWSSAVVSLNLPLPQECSSRRCWFVLKVTPFGASSDRPVAVIVRREEFLAESDTVVTYTKQAPQVLNVLACSSGPSCEVWIHVPSATSPRQLLGTADKRTLGIALHSVDIKIEDR